MAGPPGGNREDTYIHLDAFHWRHKRAVPPQQIIPAPELEHVDLVRLSGCFVVYLATYTQET